MLAQLEWYPWYISGCPENIDLRLPCSLYLIRRQKIQGICRHNHDWDLYIGQMEIAMDRENALCYKTNFRQVLT